MGGFEERQEWTRYGQGRKVDGTSTGIDIILGVLDSDGNKSAILGTQTDWRIEQLVLSNT